MKRHSSLALALLALALAVPANAQYYAAPQNALRVRAGLFTPEAEGEYFEQSFRDFTGDADGFEDGLFGIEYSRAIGPLVEVVIGGSFYESTQSQAYRDFEDAEGFDIVHDTILDAMYADLGLRIKLAPTHSTVVPYIGGGGTFVAWSLAEEGDFIDFNPPPAEIFDDRFESDGTTFGYFLMAGLDIQLSREFGLFVEGRWRDAEDDLADDFEDFGTLDLTGREITGGISWRF